MKRFYFVIALVAIVGVSSASAQGVFDREVGPFTFTEATPTRQILNDLSKEGFAVKIEGVPPLDNTYRGTIPRMTLSEVIDLLMEASNSTATMSDNLLTIYAPGLKPPVAELVQRPPVSASPETTNPATEHEARIEEIRKKYPEAYRADGTRGDAVQMLNMQNEIAALNNPPPVPGPAQVGVGMDSRFQFQYGYPMVPPQDSRFMGAVNYGYGNAYYDPYGYYLLAFDRCVANPRHRDCRMGKLKLNGEGAHFLSEFLRASFGGNGLLSKVDIYIQPIYANGTEGPVDNLGPASKRNNIFNKALRLPVGRYRVKFVLVERNLLLYDQSTQVWSEWDTKGEPTILQVDGNHFRNAPFLIAVERDWQSKKAAEVLK